jgi:nicotinamide mononucleotide (NMN) deamidase PncC
MAEGLSVLETGAEILVAITGTASAPVNSYSTSAPAGSVFVCIGFKKRFHSFEAKFAGSRQQVMEKAVEFVLETVQELVKGG